jgi:hypothetical protein
LPFSGSVHRCFLSLCRFKWKAELLGPTPAKSLRASAVVINRTAAQDADWVQRLEAAKERLRQQQAAA